MSGYSSEKLRRFMALSEEQKVRVVKTIINHFKELYRREGPVSAGLRFLKFLATEDGAIVWGYMAKPEYAEEWAQLGVAIIESVPRIATVLLQAILSQGAS